MHCIIWLELLALYEMSGIHLEKSVSSDPLLLLPIAKVVEMEKSFVRPDTSVSMVNKRNNCRISRVIFWVKISVGRWTIFISKTENPGASSETKFLKRNVDLLITNLELVAKIVS